MGLPGSRKTTLASKLISLINVMFAKLEKYDYHVTTKDAEGWAPKIAKEI